MKKLVFTLLILFTAHAIFAQQHRIRHLETKPYDYVDSASRTYEFDNDVIDLEIINYGDAIVYVSVNQDSVSTADWPVAGGAYWYRDGFIRVDKVMLITDDDDTSGPVVIQGGYRR